MTIRFLLAKDPVLDAGGDVTMTGLLMHLARASSPVEAIALSHHDAPSPDWLTRVPKGDVSPMRLLLGAARSRRSLVHRRFDVAALVEAVDATTPATWVATHSYMAESFLRSTRASDPLLVDTEVSEAEVWSLSHGALGRAQAPLIRRDELRVARAARAVGAYDRAEVERYVGAGVDATWLDVTLPPEPAVDPGAAPPRLLLLGTRDWPPNQEAFERACAAWPTIRAGIPGAELWVVGAPSTRVAPRPLPDGVRDLGFVDDLPATVAACRALIAPVDTGGGVRVKILEAASRGLPVVATSAAVGSLGPVLGLTPHDDLADFADACRRFLLDAGAAATEGARLHGVNDARWRDRAPHRCVEAWLGRAAGPPRSPARPAGT